MFTALRSPLLSMLLLAFFAFATDARAVICTPLNSPKRFVGVTDSGTPSYDPLCTDNDIQSAINAIASSANTCPATIYITHEHNYTNQHLTFDNTNRLITLVGLDNGVPCGSSNPQICNPSCPPPPTVPLLTIDANNTSGSVIHLDGQNVVDLKYLTIQRGAAAYNENGGGVYFSGTGSLTLDTTDVQNNYAGYGGGIYFNGNGATTATLTINANSQILANTAQFSGGGIRVDGNAALLAAQDGTLIAVNKALGFDPVQSVIVEGYGGGLEVLGPARADIGSPGYNGIGVIYDNTALYGGGVALFAATDGGPGDSGWVNFYTTDPARPVSIQGNIASVRGGAMYGKGFCGYDTFVEAEFCASNYRIVDNAAADGAAVYLDSDSNFTGDSIGSRLHLNTSSCGGPAGVQCTPGTACNQIWGNVSQDIGGNPTGGPAIVVGKTGSLIADKLDLRGSNGVNLINIDGQDYKGFYVQSQLTSCLLADNSVSEQLIYDGSGALTINNCTIAGNSIGGSVTAYSGSIENSLIFQPGVATGGFGQARYVLANDVSQLPPDVTVQTLVDPKFADAAGGDYHLQLISPAVDFAGGLGGTDLDGYPRDVDQPAHANFFGPRDLGAYELQLVPGCDSSADLIFCGDFDASP